MQYSPRRHRLRGRGRALRQAVVALPYHWDTNPGMIRQGPHAVARILGDGPSAT